MTHVVVVGGGITGLAAAWEAQRRGAEVTVLDAGERFGGKLRSVAFAGRTVDVGADAFLVRRPEGVQLAAELGLGDDLVHPSAARVWMWARGALRPMPAETVFGVPSRIGPVARSRALPPAAVVRAALEPLVSRLRGIPRLGARDHADEPSVRAVVAQAFGPAVADDLVEPLLGGIYAGRADRLGLWSASPALAVPLSAGQELGSLTAALRAQRAATDPAAPVFATLPDGLGALVDRLVDRLRDGGADLRVRHAVRGLERRSDGRFALSLVPPSAPRPDVDRGGASSDALVDGRATPIASARAGGADGRAHVDAGGTVLFADVVVVTVPAEPAALLLRTLAPVAAQRLEAITYADVATVSLAYRRADVSDVPPGSGVLVPARSGLLVKAMTWGWQKWAHQGRRAAGAADVVTLRASVGRVDDHRALARADADLAKRVDAEVRAITGIHGPAVDRRVTRWPRGLPQYEPGHATRVAEVHRDVARIRGLAVAGAALDGVGVAPCIAQGRAAARHALAPT